MLVVLCSGLGTLCQALWLCKFRGRFTFYSEVTYLRIMCLEVCIVTSIWNLFLLHIWFLFVDLNCGDWLLLSSLWKVNWDKTCSTTFQGLTEHLVLASLSPFSRALYWFWWMWTPLMLSETSCFELKNRIFFTADNSCGQISKGVSGQFWIRSVVQEVFWCKLWWKSTTL